MSAQKNIDNDQSAVRKDKRKRLLKKNIEPYPVLIPKITEFSYIIKKYSNLKIGIETSDKYGVAGRIMFIRDIGKLIFVRVQNGRGENLQVMLNANVISKNQFANFKEFVDLGDLIYAYGKIISSKTGELTVLANDWKFVSKSLRPLPVLHKDLSDDTRIRNRSIELITSENARKNSRLRIEVIKSLRHFLEDKGFLELETPMLQTINGGAAAKPFKTHMNAYNMDLYLRIAPELFLKRAVVGGFEKIFEINRNFRNEGADSNHVPEFTMLELYKAYSDYNDMADLTKKMIQNICKKITGGSLEIELINKKTYSFSDNQWSKISFFESLSKAVSKTIDSKTSISDLKKIAKKFNVQVSSVHQKIKGKFIEALFEELVVKKLYKPTFVYDFPIETSPLTRQSRSGKDTVEKWDLYVRGSELATAYSELVDPVIQRKRFEEQTLNRNKGDNEAMKLDNDFLQIIENGLPPMGGMGMGIDRLIIAFTGLGIRDTILFPLVKPI